MSEEPTEPSGSPDKDQRQCFYARVPKNINEAQLQDIFEQHGFKVSDLVMFRRSARASVTKGCGLVTFETHEMAAKALDSLHDKYLFEATQLTMFLRWVNDEQNDMQHGEGSNSTGTAKQQETPPEGCDPDCMKLYIGNIPLALKESDLMPLFAPYGDVVELAIIRHKNTKSSLGFAFLWMRTREQVESVIKNLNLKHRLDDPSGQQPGPLLVRPARAETSGSSTKSHQQQLLLQQQANAATTQETLVTAAAGGVSISLCADVSVGSITSPTPSAGSTPVSAVSDEVDSAVRHVSQRTTAQLGSCIAPPKPLQHTDSGASNQGSYQQQQQQQQKQQQLHGRVDAQLTPGKAADVNRAQSKSEESLFSLFHQVLHPHIKSSPDCSTQHAKPTATLDSPVVTRSGPAVHMQQYAGSSGVVPQQSMLEKRLLASMTMPQQTENSKKQAQTDTVPASTSTIPSNIFVLPTGSSVQPSKSAQSHSTPVVSVTHPHPTSHKVQSIADAGQTQTRMSGTHLSVLGGASQQQQQQQQPSNLVSLLQQLRRMQLQATQPGSTSAHAQRAARMTLSAHDASQATSGYPSLEMNQNLANSLYNNGQFSKLLAMPASAPSGVYTTFPTSSQPRLQTPQQVVLSQKTTDILPQLQLTSDTGVSVLLPEQQDVPVHADVDLSALMRQRQRQGVLLQQQQLVQEAGHSGTMQLQFTLDGGYNDGNPLNLITTTGLDDPAPQQTVVSVPQMNVANVQDQPATTTNLVQVELPGFGPVWVKPEQLQQQQPSHQQQAVIAVTDVAGRRTSSSQLYTKQAVLTPALLLQQQQQQQRNMLGLSQLQAASVGGYGGTAVNVGHAAQQIATRNVRQMFDMNKLCQLGTVAASPANTVLPTAAIIQAIPARGTINATQPQPSALASIQSVNTAPQAGIRITQSQPHAASAASTQCSAGVTVNTDQLSVVQPLLSDVQATTGSTILIIQNLGANALLHISASTEPQVQQAIQLITSVVSAVAS